MKSICQGFMLLSLWLNQSAAEPRISAIAHAGGGIQGSTYTNSFEALKLNYAIGFELFELDFSWTTDGRLVCLHDWYKTPKWLLDNDQQKPMSLAQFKAHDERRTDVTLCDLQSLNQWLKAHPKAYIVTDIKEKNTQGLRLMLDAIDSATTRIIPQFFHSDEYPAIQSMGFKSTIWSIYQYPGNNQHIIEAAAEMDLFALAMPPHKAKGALPKKISGLKIPVYVHTINDKNVALNYINNHHISSIYTDFLSPDFNQQTTTVGSQ